MMYFFRNRVLLGKHLWSIIFLVLLSSQVQAQDYLISGTVVDENAEPLPGVNIIFQGSTTGTATDLNGKFKISVPHGISNLMVTAIGYKSITVPIAGRTVIDISMELGVESLEEVVMIGYGKQDMREVTGAIVQVKSEDLIKFATSDLASAIQGQMAGVSVRSISGTPGENASITIRGISSFQDGGSEPLYVVDGVTYTSNPNIALQEIESIEVLKDAASAAIYGSRASAGVVLITTKKGGKGDMKINLDSYYGVQHLASGIELASIVDDVYINKIQSRGNDIGFYNPFENAPNGLYYNTNWLDELRVDVASIQSHSLRVSGGSDNLTYNIVGTLFNQDGVMINSGYKRQNIRANTTFERGGLSIDVNMGLSHDLKDTEPWALQYDAIKQEPYHPKITKGTEYVVEGDNPENMGKFIGKINQINEGKGNGYNGNVRISYEILNGLKLNANIGGSLSRHNEKWFAPTYHIYNYNEELLPHASNLVSEMKYTEYQHERTIQEYTATYNKTFAEKHEISLLVGNTWETSVARELYVHGAGFPSNDAQSMGAANEIRSSSEAYAASNTMGILGRIQYNYDKRYMLSASIRCDKSSRFHPDNNAGYFPSFSAGWNVSQEDFFEPYRDVVSLLKIRYGYGQTGSDKAGQGLTSPMADLPYQAIVTPQVDYVLGSGSNEYLHYGSTAPTFVDQDIRWETNISQNLGIDGEFFNGRILFSADVYKADKENMLLAVAIPPSTGASSNNNYNQVWQNVGNLTNKGVELAIGYNQYFGDLHVKANVTFTKNINKVEALAPTIESIAGGDPMFTSSSESTTFLKPGYAAGAFFLIPTQGVIKTEEELAAYKELVPSAKLGDLKYVDKLVKDTDGDGIADTGNGKIEQDDRVYMGSGTPDWEASLSVNLIYKHFDFGVQLLGSYGGEIYNGSKAYAYQTKRSKELVNAWSPANHTSNIPTPRQEIEHYNTRTFSDYFLEDGSYLRIQNITLGYTLPENVLSKINVENCRIYLSAQNPITFTNYTGFDPEVGSQSVLLRGVDSGNYPVSANYRMGISLEF